MSPRHAATRDDPRALAMIGWALALVSTSVAVTSTRRLRSRMELVARAAHELRGPIAAARLGVHLLAREEARRPGASRRAGAVDAELRRTSLALADLEAARAGRRAGEERRPVDVGDLLAACADAWRPVARAAGGDLHLRVPAVPAVVLGDRVRLAQACGNLVANAIEHGAGQVELGASVARARVRIEVADGGPGLGTLAVRPARAGRGRRGRGLAIVAEIAERHGGRLATVPEGPGTRVAIELPVRGSLAAP